jgi:hypothetical protein
VNKGFTPRMVGLLEPYVRELAGRLIDGVAAKGTCDLVNDLAVPLPLYIIAEMLGIRREDFTRFHDWSDRLIAVAGNYHDPAKLNDSAAAYIEYGTYLQEIFEDRRVQPREDLVSILVAAQQSGMLAEDEEAMENDEIVMFMTLLLVAGNETTRNGITGGMLALMENPDQRALLAARPDLLDGAVEEILRYVSPIICFRRTAVADTVIRDQVARAARRDVVDEPPRELAHERLQETDHAGREALVDQLPEPLMPRIVHADDRHDRVGLGQDALGRRKRFGGLRDVHDVVVARQDPEPAVRVPVHGRVLAEPPVRGIRIAGVQRRIGQVRLHGRGRLTSAREGSRSTGNARLTRRDPGTIPEA